MRLTPLLVALALLPSPAAVADQIYVPDHPQVLVLARRERADDYTSTLERIDGAGTSTALLAGLPTASMTFNVHEATGRWALVFQQLSNGDPLELDGKAVSKPHDRNTLVLGDRSGVVGHTYGDKKCTSETKVCFETPLAWTPDGKYVYVESLRSTWNTVGRWNFGKKPKRVEISAKKPGTFKISPDGKRATYLANDGVHAVTFPKAKKKPTKIKATKKATVDPRILMYDAWPIGDKLYWFRRDLENDQKQGWYESYDLVTKETKTLLASKTDYYMPRTPFLSTGPRGTVLFAHDTQFERADLYEVSGDGTAVVITQDIYELHDVSDDGRFALVSRRKDPAAGLVPDNPELLVVVDLVTHQDVQVMSLVGDRIIGAGFTATK